MARPRPVEMRAAWLHRAFEASLLFKGLFAVTEALLGVLLFFVSNESFRSLITRLTAHEIIEDPTDAVARFLMDGAQVFSLDTQSFYATYLAGHGLLKLAVVVLLARGFLWAYPLAVTVLAGFILYQLHRFVLTPGPALILLSLLDAVVIVLTVIEYRRIRGSA